MVPALVLSMADLRQLEIRAGIDEADVAASSLGQAAYATADAYGDRRFPVKLTRVTRELGRNTVRDDDPRACVAPRVLEDAKRLASDLFKSLLLTTGAWFASVKLASFLLKFIPGAGTVTAYMIDAAVAGIGARKITARLGTAAAIYYKSGRRLAPKTVIEHVKNLTADPRLILKVLSFATVGSDLTGVDDVADFADGAVEDVVADPSDD